MQQAMSLNNLQCGKGVSAQRFTDI